MIYLPIGQAGVNSLYCKNSNQTLLFVHNPKVIEILDKLKNVYRCFMVRSYSTDGINEDLTIKSYVANGNLKVLEGGK